MAGLRFFVAGSLLYGFMRMRGQPSPSPAEWRSIGPLHVCRYLRSLVLGRTVCALWYHLRDRSDPPHDDVGGSLIAFTAYVWLVARMPATPT